MFYELCSYIFFEIGHTNSRRLVLKFENAMLLMVKLHGDSLIYLGYKHFRQPRFKMTNQQFANEGVLCYSIIRMTYQIVLRSVMLRQ